MPQMMPLNWMMIYIFMLTIFILIIMINYTNFIYSTSLKSNMKINYTLMNWKW
nr:ATP synthase F0 subunit 8 [Odontocerum albicorne]